MEWRRAEDYMSENAIQLDSRASVKAQLDYLHITYVGSSLRSLPTSTLTNYYTSNIIRNYNNRLRSKEWSDCSLKSCSEDVIVLG